jgi:hypothetical protein
MGLPIERKPTVLEDKTGKKTGLGFTSPKTIGM